MRLSKSQDDEHMRTGHVEGRRETRDSHVAGRWVCVCGWSMTRHI